MDTRAKSLVSTAGEKMIEVTKSRLVPSRLLEASRELHRLASWSMRLSGAIAATSSSFERRDCHIHAFLAWRAFCYTAGHGRNEVGGKAVERSSAEGPIVSPRYCNAGSLTSKQDLERGSP